MRCRDRRAERAVLNIIREGSVNNLTRSLRFTSPTRYMVSILNVYVYLINEIHVSIKKRTKFPDVSFLPSPKIAAEILLLYSEIQSEIRH